MVRLFIPDSAIERYHVGPLLGTQLVDSEAIEPETLTQALAGARSVQTLADPHVSALLPPQVVQRQPLRLFSDVSMHCTSFSAWWNRTTRGVTALGDLPGLAV